MYNNPIIIPRENNCGCFDYPGMTTTSVMCSADSTKGKIKKIKIRPMVYFYDTKENWLISPRSDISTAVMFSNQLREIGYRKKTFRSHRGGISAVKFYYAKQAPHNRRTKKAGVFSQPHIKDVVVVDC